MTDTGMNANSFTVVTDGGSYEGTQYVSAYLLEMIGVDADYAIGRDLKDDSYSAFEFVVTDNVATHYCQHVFGASSLEDAVDGLGADGNDLEEGCGETGFPWSSIAAVDPGLDFVGTGNFGESFSMDSSLISVAYDGSPANIYFHARKIDTDNGNYSMISVNGSENGFNPNLWSRFDIVIDGTDLLYCQISYDSADFMSALSAGASDASDVDTGCNGFGWTVVSP
jgi:hypothetical protein